MAEYIDRDALKDRMANFVPPFIDENNQAYVDGLTDAYTLICQTPASDVVERKNGSWRHYEGELTCSECAVTIYDDIMSLLGDDVPRFCPNCGANMEEDQFDDNPPMEYFESGGI